jgi:hypothetical protein
MSIPVPLAVCAAILLSAAIVVTTTATGLYHTPFCLMPSLGVVVLIWIAYPPAQQLPPIVSIVFWALITLVMYHFPTPLVDVPTIEAQSLTDDDLLDQFFKETSTQ